MNRNKQQVGVLTAVAFTLLAACGSAGAQTKAFKITGAGVGPEGIPLPGSSAPHWAVGNATHLGKYSGEGAVHTDKITAIDPDTGVISGEFGSAVPFVFTAANGERLACHYGRADVVSGKAQAPGTFTLIPQGDGTHVAFWVAEFVPVVELCTGKFAGVKGSWVMYAISEPFVLGSTDPAGYSWEGEGSLTFAKGSGK